MPCLIVGTQVDLRDDPSVREKLSKQKMSPVRKEDGERMAKELGAVKYVECSALTQFKLKDVFDEVSDDAINADGMLVWQITNYNASARQSWLHWNPQPRRRSQKSALCYNGRDGQIIRHLSTPAPLPLEQEPGATGYLHATRWTRSGRGP